MSWWACSFVLLYPHQALRLQSQFAFRLLNHFVAKDIATRWRLYVYINVCVCVRTKHFLNTYDFKASVILFQCTRRVSPSLCLQIHAPSWIQQCAVSIRTHFRITMHSSKGSSVFIHTDQLDLYISTGLGAVNYTAPVQVCRYYPSIWLAMQKTFKLVVAEASCFTRDAVAPWPIK